MENAQLISLSRQIALQRQMDVVANNLANINTTGFKAEQLLFDEYQMPVAKDRAFTGGDQRLSFTEDWATLHDLSGGSITDSGNPLDVAIDGDGFFAVQTPAGERWTRAGALQLNATGTLVDLNGNPVLGNDGPIQFQAGDTDISIAANGAITTSAGARGTLRVVGFDNPQALERDGDNYFSGGTPRPAPEASIVQGAVEKSNVSGVTEMAEMIRVSRAYQSLATLMQQQTDMRHTAVQRLGQLAA